MWMCKGRKVVVTWLIVIVPDISYTISGFFNIRSISLRE
jgi:hypothetical protein